MKETKTGKFKYEFVVNEDVLDSYGHVNNAEYLKFYEIARWKILEQSNLGEEAVQKTGKGPVILEVNIRFSREIRSGQKIIIETSSRRKGSKIFYFDQVMKDEEGNICSKAVFTAALFDLKKRKMIVPDKQWRNAFLWGNGESKPPEFHRS